MAISPGGRPADASPLGKPGSARGLTDYVREVAHALMRKGVPKGHAIAIARSQQAKWMVKSKNPAIRAASAASLAEQHVLDHRKRDMSRAFEVGGASLVDLNWAAFDQSRPKGAARPAAAPPPGAKGGAAQPAQPNFLTPQTQANVAAFQKANGLPADGTLNAKTVAFLNSPASNKAGGKGGGKGAAGKAAKAAKASAAAAKKAAATTAKNHAAYVKANQARAAGDRKRLAAQAAGQAKATKLSVKKAGIGGPVRQVALSVPIVASQDGPRITSTGAAPMKVKSAPFGGKRAPLFKKGGGRQPAKTAKAANMAKAELVRREIARRKAAK